MGDLSTFLSAGTGDLGRRVEELVRDHALLWRSAPAGPPPPGRCYARADKRNAERDFSDLVAKLSSAEVRGACLDGSLEPSRLEELAGGLRPGFKRVIRLADLPLEAVYDARFVDSTRRFLQAARDFDPGLDLDSAYQALRNVWIMNSLQFDLGLPVEPTDAVFAYSMVYPYLDNVLDDAGSGEGGKLALLARLRSWLEGSPQAAASAREEKLFSLVRLIEGRFSRLGFPGVYESLLAIYNGQVKSLLQQRQGAATTGDEILSISLEKGGTSVLADGYLVAGALGPEDEEFCFAFGTFLQLADDLQDIAEDIRCGRRTWFSTPPDGAPLDQAVLRLESYIGAVLRRARRKGTAGRAALCDVIGNGVALMVREAVGKQPDRFSRAFVRRAGRAFPVRFSYLRRLRRRLAGMIPRGGTRLADIDPGLAALMALSSRALALD
ncbi:MAG: class 1 isoprenoid biosynthesis enzyme [Candidatus Aminicenantes bacterium]|nr:class 1 isoprenoid biosynthesis enzyme [Candidatus Aminicenantes bacterium]